VPFGLGWVIKPFITEVPKDSLTFTLQRVRAALSTPRASSVALTTNRFGAGPM
jgi:hypothetical protein